MESSDKMRLDRLREDLESEHQGRCEGLEKKYAYKMEQLRQEFADKQEQVIETLLITATAAAFTIGIIWAGNNY